MVGRVELIAQFLGGGIPPAPATCVSDHFVTDPTLTPLLQKAELSKSETRLLQTSVQKFVSACGGS
jgi:hypothetical protein